MGLNADDGFTHKFCATGSILTRLWWTMADSCRAVDISKPRQTKACEVVHTKHTATQQHFL